MGLALIIIGLVLWLAAGWFVVGVVLIAFGLVLLLAPGPWHDYDWHRGRGAPPP